MGILIILIPFRYRILLKSRPVGNIYGDYTDFILFGHDIVLLALLSIWILAKLLRRESFARGPMFLTIPLAAFTGWVTIFGFASFDPGLSYYHALRAIVLLGLYFYLVDQKFAIKTLLPWIAVQIAVQAAAGIYQLIYQRDLGLQILGEYLLNPDWEGVSIVLTESGRWLRAYGFSDHPNILGGSLAIGLLIIAGYYLLDGAKTPKWPLAVIVLGSAGLTATFSRSAWLAFFVGVGVLIFFYIRSRKRERIVHLIGSLLVGILPLMISFWSLLRTRLLFFEQAKISPAEVQSIGERIFLNQASLDIFVRFPILGVGFGSLPQALRFEHPDILTYYQPAHFVWITAAAEIGLIGSTIYILALILPLLVFSLNKNLQVLPTSMIATSGLISISIIGLLDYYPWLLSTGRLWQYLLWGVWAGAYPQASSSQKND